MTVESEGPTVRSVLVNLEEMAYNCNESASDVKEFLSSFGTKLSSIVNGRRFTATEDSTEEFTISEYKFKINYFSEGITGLGLVTKTHTVAETEELLVERKTKLMSLLNQYAHQLCVAESLSTGVPAWQVQQYDFPVWMHQLSSDGDGVQPMLNNAVTPTLRILLPFGNYHHGATTQRLLALLGASLGLRRIEIVVCALKRDSLPALIPIVNLIQTVNQNKIWSSPIELRIVAASSCGTLLAKQEFLIWNPEEMAISRDISLKSGVFTSGTTSDYCVQYVVDSSADLESAVDAITADKWESGTQVLRRRLCLVLVHESVQSRLIDLFGNSMTKMTGENVTTTVQPEYQHSMKKAGEASLLYDIGTSTPYLADFSESPLSQSPPIRPLFILPYRNMTELLSLVNDFGGVDIHKTVCFFTSCVSVVPQFATRVQALGGIWINKVSHQRIPASFYNTGERVGEAAVPPAVESRSKLDWSRIVEQADKGFRAWSTMTLEIRLKKVSSARDTCSFFRTHIQHQQLLEMVIRSETWTRKEASKALKSGGLVSFVQRPHGIVGIVVGSESNPDYSKIMEAVVMTVLKGNAVVMVVSGQGTLPDGLVELETVLPSGLFQCVRVETMTKALKGLAQQGKVSLVWALCTSLEFTKGQVPTYAFTNILVDNVPNMKLELRSNHLEITTPVYF